MHQGDQAVLEVPVVEQARGGVGHGHALGLLVQPGVGDVGRRLFRHGGQQLQVGLAVLIGLRTLRVEHAEDASVPLQGDTGLGARPLGAGHVAAVGLDVAHGHRLAGLHHPAGYALAFGQPQAQGQRTAVHRLDDQVARFFVGQQELAVGIAEETDGISQNDVEQLPDIQGGRHGNGDAIQRRQAVLGQGQFGVEPAQRRLPAAEDAHGDGEEQLRHQGPTQGEQGGGPRPVMLQEDQAVKLKDGAKEGGHQSAADTAEDGALHDGRRDEHPVPPAGPPGNDSEVEGEQPHGQPGGAQQKCKATSHGVHRCTPRRPMLKTTAKPWWASVRPPPPLTLLGTY